MELHNGIDFIEHPKTICSNIFSQIHVIIYCILNLMMMIICSCNVNDFRFY